MELKDLLISLGLNIYSSAVYDFIKLFLKSEPDPAYEKCVGALQAHLKIGKGRIYSEKIIEFLAKNGDIEISGSFIFARKSILFQSSRSANFQIKDNSFTKTDHNSIEVGTGCSITGKGGATITQSEKGITFLT